MATLTTLAAWINWLLSKRDKTKAVQWLEIQGNTVNKIEWTFYGKWSIRRYSAFDAMFVDKSGKHHHAFIAVPMTGKPWFLEDAVS